MFDKGERDPDANIFQPADLDNTLTVSHQANDPLDVPASGYSSYAMLLASYGVDKADKSDHSFLGEKK